MQFHLRSLILAFATCLASPTFAQEADPNEIEATIASETLQDGRTRVVITYPTAAGNNYVVEFREQIGPDGWCSEWSQLPGAPHNSGLVWEFDEEPERFYRVLRIDQPQSNLFALLANDTGFLRTDGITSDAAIAGMAGGSPGYAALLVQLNGTDGSFTDVSQAIDADSRFRLSHEDVAELNGGNLPDGQHTLHLRVVDSGDAVLDEFAVSFTLDTTPPPLTLALSSESDSPPVGDQITNMNPVTLLGTTEAGLLVELAPGGYVTTADAEGSFRFENIVLSSEAQVFTAGALDSACNLGTVSLLLTHGNPPIAGCVSNAPPDWVVIESGGSQDGHGGVFMDENCKPVLRSGDSFMVGLELDFTVPHEPSFLIVTLGDVNLDAASGGIRDAFEISLTDTDGNSLVRACPSAQGVNKQRAASVFC